MYEVQPQQPAQNPEQQLQAAVNAFREQVQKAAPEASGNYRVNVEGLRTAALNAIQSQPNLIPRIQGVLNAVVPGSGSLLPTDAKQAVEFVNKNFNNVNVINLTPERRTTLLAALNIAPAAPEIEQKVKQALAKVQTHLNELRQQVETTRKSTELLRQNTAKSMVELRSVSTQRYESLVKSLNLALTGESQQKEIAASLETLDKRSEAISKGLDDLAREVAPTREYPAPSDNVTRHAGRVTVAIDRAVNSAFNNPSVAKFMQDWFGMNANDVREMVLSGITDMLAGFRAASMGLPAGLAQGVENTARGIADELKFQSALNQYAGDRSQVNAEWRSRYLARVDVWERNVQYYNRNRVTNTSLVDPGRRPTIEDARPNSPQLVNYEQEFKNKQDATSKVDQENAKAQKEAKEDIAAVRNIDGRTIPGDGLLITAATPIDPINIGNKTVVVRRNASGDYQIKVTVTGQAAHDNWINVVTSTRPNSMRLCAPRGTTSLADLRLVTQTPDGTPNYWKRTGQLTLSNIAEQIDKRGAASALTVVLADDNSGVTIRNPAEVKAKEQESQAKRKAEELLKAAGTAALTQIEALPKLLTEAQQKLEAGQALIKQMPDLLRIARSSIAGQPIGLGDSLTLLQAYQRLSTIGGPTLQPVMKTMTALLMRTDVQGVLQSGQKILASGTPLFEELMKNFNQANQKMSKEEAAKIVEQLFKLNIP